MLVTVIGLGPMGQALASALLAAGHDVTVHNRTEAKAAELLRRGAAWAATPADAVSASELTLINVVDNHAVGSIVAQAGKALEGNVIVGLASDTPASVPKVADAVATFGGRYLDGAIMTPIETIGSSSASILFAGPNQLFEAHREVFDSLGSTTWLGEGLTLAAGYDMALLSLFWSSTASFLHALQLAGAVGIKPADFLPHALGIVDILAPIFTDAAERVAEDRHGAATSSASSIANSLRHLESASVEAGLDATALRALRTRVDEAVAKGYGDDEVTRISFAATSS